jgi:hypothetical protein
MPDDPSATGIPSAPLPADGVIRYVFAAPGAFEVGYATLRAGTCVAQNTLTSSDDGRGIMPPAVLSADGNPAGCRLFFAVVGR